MISYLDEKLPEVENHINAFSKHIYDVKNDRSLGALLNLVQHHGYPTPLLDWTKSPYAAAFFAYENKAMLKGNGRRNISIFIFNERKWADLAGRTAQIRSPSMSLKTLELPGYGNVRALPQQSITMFSNVADIEYVIDENEKQSGIKFIEAISLPISDREIAIRDLGNL